LKKSWLSREILFVGLFGAGWLAGFVLPEMKWVTSLIGAGLIYSMAKVYQLRPMPAWNTWRTMAGFFITAALLGHVAMLVLLGAKSGREVFAVLTLLALELGIMLSAKPKAHRSAIHLRVGLSVTAMLGAGTIFIAPNLTGLWISLPILLLVMIEEVIGRMLFYEPLKEKALF